MAISNNPLTHGASGMLGGVLVFRTWNGKTYMYNRPKKPSKQSESQKDNRNRFRMATHYAKSMMADPAKKVEYQEKARQLNLPNAYTAAITEYLRKPEIAEIEITDGPVSKEREVKIIAGKKGFDADPVEVIIQSAEGKEIQKGAAIKERDNNWRYSFIVENDKDPIRVIVRTKAKYGLIVEKVITI
jgi:hypothetical protein